MTAATTVPTDLDVDVTDYELVRGIHQRSQLREEPFCRMWVFVPHSIATAPDGASGVDGCPRPTTRAFGGALSGVAENC